MSPAIWDQSVICYPTQVNAPRLNHNPQAGTRFTYPRGMEGLTLGGLVHTWMV